MKLFVCSVFDSAMAAFGRPLFVPTLGVAMRSFTDEVNRAAADNHLNAHADDFVLWAINIFDEEKGTFVGTQDDFRILARAKDVKHTKES